MINLSDYSSPYNHLAEIATPSQYPAKVEIHDLTLEADGEEMAGLKFSHDQRLDIARMLDAAGVHRLSILGNSPQPTAGEIRSAEAIVRLGLQAKLGAFVKTKEEIETCARIGLWGVTILVGVNDAVLTGGRNGQDIVDQCKSLTSTARELNLHTCLMGMDATRTSPEFLKRLVTELDPYFDEFVIGDSLGRISPFGMRHLVSLVGKWTRKPLQIHPHNHTSVGVANCLGAAMGGASVMQTTMHGVGEFTGLAPTEELAVALEMHCGIASDLNIPQLRELAQFVASCAGLQTPPHKPVSGSASFSIPETEEIQQCLYELNLEGRFNDGLPYPPERVGGHSHMSIGRKCNAYTVLYNLAVMGTDVSMEQAELIARSVRDTLRGRDGYVLMDEDEFLSHANELRKRLS